MQCHSPMCAVGGRAQTAAPQSKQRQRGTNASAQGARCLTLVTMAALTPQSRNRRLPARELPQHTVDNATAMRYGMRTHAVVTQRTQQGQHMEVDAITLHAWVRMGP